MVRGKWGACGVCGLWGGGAFMHLVGGWGGSACVFLEQSREVLKGGGEKWCNWNVEMKLREKMLCWGSCGVRGSSGGILMKVLFCRRSEIGRGVCWWVCCVFVSLDK